MPTAVPSEPLPDVVLVGGGHAHVQVMNRWAMARPPARLTVIVDRPTAVYSGMVPGLVAGQYASEELEIDVVRLARRVGARVVLAPVRALDVHARTLTLGGRPPFRYDVASFNIGATVSGAERPGVREHALPTRPIADFVDRWENLVTAGPPASDICRVVVVGGGSAGVELAACALARLRSAGRAHTVTLVTSGALLPGASPSLRSRVLRALHTRGIGVLVEATVDAVTHASVQLASGQSLPADAVLWATGAASWDVFRRSGLPVDDAGFVRVRNDLSIEGAERVFAAGDCAALPWGDIPKAGVYAVRQGPLLYDNLVATVLGRTTRSYRPQSDFLTLLNLGDGTAIGSKWGLSVEGRWVQRWKDRIDRRFMARFQPAPDAQPMAGMDEMVCGGCAAKVAPKALSSALGRLSVVHDPSVRWGVAERDDAALVAYGDAQVVASIDGFRAFSDDAWLVGGVAALNAVHDVLAKGAVARHALAWVTVPEDHPAEETLFQVMSGVRGVLDAHRVTVVGGHSTLGPELTVGLAVLGTPHPTASMWRLGGAQPGDAIVCVGRFGTGVLLRADGLGVLPGEHLAALHRHLLRSLAPVIDAARGYEIHAATDVTGFGLAGHLRELALASRVHLRVGIEAIDPLPGALALLRQGVRSTYHPESSSRSGGIMRQLGVGEAEWELLFDPQTAGGMLFAVAPDQATALVAAVRATGDSASILGWAEAPGAGTPWMTVQTRVPRPSRVLEVGA